MLPLSSMKFSSQYISSISLFKIFPIYLFYLLHLFIYLFVSTGNSRNARRLLAKRRLIRRWKLLSPRPQRRWTAKAVKFLFTSIFWSILLSYISSNIIALLLILQNIVKLTLLLTLQIYLSFLNIFIKLFKIQNNSITWLVLVLFVWNFPHYHLHFYHPKQSHSIVFPGKWVKILFANSLL